MLDNTSSGSQRTSTSPALQIRNIHDDIDAGANTAILENYSPSNGYIQDGSWKGRYDRRELVVLQQQSVQEKARWPTDCSSTTNLRGKPEEGCHLSIKCQLLPFYHPRAGPYNQSTPCSSCFSVDAAPERPVPGLAYIARTDLASYIFSSRCQLLSFNIYFFPPGSLWYFSPNLSV